MKATVLVDNISKEGICGEWGLSIYIEYQGKNILLDAGASDLFLKNADKIGKKIENVDYAVLSHAHYDHADGMETFFKHNKKALFYLQKGCEENCYHKKWIFKKYIGLPKGILEKYKDRIVFASGDYKLCPGVSLIPHKTPGLDKAGRKNKMLIRTKDGWKADDFSHEQSLVFDTPEGLVIFNSCSHGGADNIINEVKATYPDRNIRALIGGFHIYKRTEEEVRELARRIKDTGIGEIYTGHCTGKHSYDILKEELGDIAHQLSAGLKIEI
ncbi:MAG: MBL fold metallo-hydrolase [Eubacteriales bacterium]|nr:MBL fold metallo-hydrolase [Eubacteriales bacterium]